MLGYILKRVVRGWKSFIALFLGVAIATTLFSGTMIGAENVGRGMLDEAMSLVPVDIVVADLLRNISSVDVSIIEAEIRSMDRVEYTEQVIRWEAPINYIKKKNPARNVDFTIVAFEENSRLWRQIFGEDFEGIGPNEIYIESDSIHAPLIEEGINATLSVFTHDPVSMGNYTTFQFDFDVAGFLDLDSKSYLLSTGEYPFFLRWILFGAGLEIRKPPHDLLFMDRSSFYSIFNQVYKERKLPNKQITVEVLVDLDREGIVNPWDVGNSINRVQLISEQIDNEVRIYNIHSWQNFLQDVLETVRGITDSLKMGFILIALPVFFTAWYMGGTVSDVSLSSRRREIGLLLTKGFTRRQLFVMFVVEAILIGLLSGLVGIVMSSLIIPLLGFGTATVGASLPSLSTVVLALVFSTVIALLSVLIPAWRISGITIIDALREYWGAEEKLPNREEPVIALILGLYKLLMFLFGISVESYRPIGGGLIVFILYSTWWGVDLILTYIGPILFFWGFTRLLIQGSIFMQEAIGSVASRLIGDLSKLSMLSARRTLRRTAAVAFLVALIFGYSVSVIGGLASTEDRLVRVARSNVGADASVWLFSEEGAHELAEQIGALEGVSSTAVERWFYIESAFLSIQLRAIDPEAWWETAFFEEDWFTGRSDVAFQSLSVSNRSIILYKGLADASGLSLGDKITFEIRFNLFVNLTIVDLLGPGLIQGQAPQPLPSYVADGFLDDFPAYMEVIQTRILLRLDPDADAIELASIIGGMDPNIEVVDTVAEQLEAARRNIFLKGPRQVQELGVPFAALVSSVGVALVVSTTMGERRKEITLMTIRGFSSKQLIQMLAVENVSIIIFSILLGGVVGYVNALGDVALANTAGQLILSHVVFPSISILFISAIAAAIILSALVPILVATRRSVKDLGWRIME